MPRPTRKLLLLPACALVVAAAPRVGVHHARHHRHHGPATRATGPTTATVRPLSGMLDPHVEVETVRLVRPGLPTAEQLTDAMLAHAGWQLAGERAAWYAQVIANEAREVRRARSVEVAARTATVRAVARPAPVTTSAPVTTPTSSANSAVTACVKSHESGNYAEHSHPGAGSGAYQFVPSTWESYVRASRQPYTDYAYQAPPGEQDAVFQYALTHGGAGNWSTRFGNDPCTGGLPGGG